MIETTIYRSLGVAATVHGKIVQTRTVEEAVISLNT